MLSEGARQGRVVCAGRSCQSVRRGSPAEFQLRRVFEPGEPSGYVLVGIDYSGTPVMVSQRERPRGWIGTTIVALGILGIILALYHLG